MILRFFHQDSSEFVEAFAIEVPAVFKNVGLGIRPSCLVFREVGKFDHRIVDGVPKMDVGHVFRHFRQVFAKFERAAFFKRGRYQMQRAGSDVVFGEIFREKDSSKRMSDVDGGFRVQIRGEFFERELPFRVFRVVLFR